MPNKWNFPFSYYYFCIILSILYIPGTTSHNFPTFGDRHCDEVGSDKTLLFLCDDSQGFHTCSIICSPKGRRPYQRQKLHNTSKELPSSGVSSNLRMVALVCNLIFSGSLQTGDLLEYYSYIIICCQQCLIANSVSV